MTNKTDKRAEETKRIFSTGDDTFRMYLKDVDRIPLQTKEEEEKTALLAAQGDMAARERLVNSNLRFVISIAKKYQGRGLPLQDLISEGNMGLLQAVNNFKAEKGYRFITYAVWWIRQAIAKAIQDKSRMIRLPVNKNNDLNKLQKARQTLQSKPGWKSEKEIHNAAMYLEMLPKKAAALYNISQEVISLDDISSNPQINKTIYDYEEDRRYGSPLDNAANNILRTELETAINGLEKRAADVIRCRFGLGKTGPLTLKEIGSRYDLSRERVRQIEKRALMHLQRSVDIHGLSNYIV